MSEEFQDELEAINSIYGDGCLVPASENSNSNSNSKDNDKDKKENGIYILTPPGESSSLRVEFPPNYPEEPPAVIGTNSTGEGGKRGDAARELRLFRQALGSVYEPGVVCLFDALEELKRLLEEEAEQRQRQQQQLEERLRSQQEGADAGDGEADADADAEKDGSSAAPLENLLLRETPPPWTVSDPFVELRSTFVGRCARVTSVAEAEAFVQHLLATDRRVRAATHNITAWRIRGRDPHNPSTIHSNISYQDCDDDGETAAGGRLLHLMQLMGIWDAVVVVTRWYGGHKLGPRRFALINQTARDAFVKAGLVGEGDGGGSGGGGKKKGGSGKG
ncbi:hypothetical protein SLS62_000761 [Diatrype stigma]|uniref:RWD domain-containing protein n=1 Tax=Diatrype stigma TaxID=117547 RepID=A0AAN9V1B6_9PEZI